MVFTLGPGNILYFNNEKNFIYRDFKYYYDEIGASFYEAEELFKSYGQFSPMGFDIRFYIDEDKLDFVDYLNSLLMVQKLIGGKRNV